MNEGTDAWVIDVVCALMRGESPPCGATWSGASIEQFLNLVRAHGVTPLLDERFSQGDLSATWPEPVRNACHDDALASAMQELAVRAELVRVLESLDKAGVRPLILKGSALAYQVYPRPALRMRGDTDLFVPDEAVGATVAVLEEFGYARGPHSNGVAVSCQATWSRTDSLGVRHDLDVHWRANNSQVLSREVSYRELDRRAVLVPELGPHARTLSPPDALLFACMHRAGHVNTIFYSGEDVMVGGDRLIWFYDIHLMLQVMSIQEQEEFLQLATMKRMRTVCMDALQRTRDCFGTHVPSSVLEALDAQGETEPSARYLTGRRFNQVVGDLVAAPDWRFRLSWLREFCFPAADYMRAKYPQASIHWLPVLHARRAVEGARKLLSRHGAGHQRF